jgi:hypothetical protein
MQSVDGPVGNCLSWAARDSSGVLSSCVQFYNLHCAALRHVFQMQAVEGPDGNCLGWAARDSSS